MSGKNETGQGAPALGAPPSTVTEGESRETTSKASQHYVPTSDELNHWNANLKILLPLLVAWFLVSYGAGILFVDTLNQFTVPFTSAPLGMWFAQQGAIYAFVLIIYAYVLLMNMLDRTLNLQEDDDEGPSADVRKAS